MLAWLNALHMIYHLSLIDVSSCADAFNHNNTLQYTSVQFCVYQLIPVLGQLYWKKVLANIHRLVPCIWILGGISDLNEKVNWHWVSMTATASPTQLLLQCAYSNLWIWCLISFLIQQPWCPDGYCHIEPGLPRSTLTPDYFWHTDFDSEFARHPRRPCPRDHSTFNLLIHTRTSTDLI
jgi:hypothetical protein